MKTYTRQRKHGTMETATLDNDAKVKAIRDVITNGYAKVNGVMVDIFSASAIIQVYDALGEANKEKYKKLAIHRMADVAFKLCK